jgi:hypothetical protein
MEPHDYYGSGGYERMQSRGWRESAAVNGFITYRRMENVAFWVRSIRLVGIDYDRSGKCKGWWGCG